MQTQTKFVFDLLKLILNFFSGVLMLQLISSVGPSPNTKKVLV